MVANSNTLRIIGGQWRSRKLPFANIPDLRPTPDRIRETLFNWLQHAIIDARCIDLFSGSGALGLEALSRGARFCLFIDNHQDAITQIDNNLATLQCNQGQTYKQDAITLLQSGPVQQAFDIAFIDPPYAMDIALKCCESLESGDWLNDNAHIYIESPRPVTQEDLPENWHLHRQKQAGNVCYHLAIKQS